MYGKDPLEFQSQNSSVALVDNDFEKHREWLSERVDIPELFARHRGHCNPRWNYGRSHKGSSYQRGAVKGFDIYHKPWMWNANPSMAKCPHRTHRCRKMEVVNSNRLSRYLLGNSSTKVLERISCCLVGLAAGEDRVTSFSTTCRYWSK